MRAMQGRSEFRSPLMRAHPGLRQRFAQFARPAWLHPGLRGAFAKHST
jgi:hypothetical protein